MQGTGDNTMAVLEDWQVVRDELDLDESKAMDPAVLREWFGAIINSTNNDFRAKIESALSRLSKRHDAIIPLAHLIKSDPDTNIRFFAVIFLANNSGNFVDAILARENGVEQLSVVRDVLAHSLWDPDMPANLRSTMLKGYGSFLFKVIPDIWCSAVEEILNCDADPSYTLELIADLCKNVVEQPQVFSHKRQRNVFMLKRVMDYILPYVNTALDQPTCSTSTIEKSAELIRWSSSLVDADPAVAWPTICKILESGHFTFATITSIITGMRVFSSREYPRYSSLMCQCLIRCVCGPLLEAIKRSVSLACEDDLREHDSTMLELTGELTDYFGFVLAGVATTVFCKSPNAVKDFPEADPVIEGVFTFVSQLCQLPGRPGMEDPFSEMAGIFYNRLHEVMLDVVYNVDQNRKEGYCLLMAPGLDPLFVKSQLKPYDDAEQLEAVDRFRDCMTDMIALVDLLSEHQIVSFMAKKITDIQAADIPPISKLAGLSPVLYFLTCLPEPLLEDFAPHFETIKGVLFSLRQVEGYSLIKEDCTCNFLELIISLLKKDSKFEAFFTEMFMFMTTDIMGFCLYPKSLVFALTLINQYSTLSKPDEITSMELCGFIVKFSSNTSPEIQELVVLTLVNFLRCTGEDGKPSARICSFVLEFVQTRCNACLTICSNFPRVDGAALAHFRDQAKLIGYMGKNTDRVSEALEVVSPLVNILSDFLIRFLQHKIPEDDLISFTNPVCQMVTVDVIRRFAQVQGEFAWNYPGVFVRIYKSGLILDDSFVVSELICHIANITTSTFKANQAADEVSPAELAVLDLVCHLLRKSPKTFMKFVASKSTIEPTKDFLTSCLGLSLRTVLRSFSDSTISLGLRTIETILSIQNQEVLQSVSEAFPLIIPPVFDLVFSVYFHSNQAAIAQVLVTIAKYCPQVFGSYALNHKELVANDEVKFLLGTPNRALFLKYFLRWNMNWNKSA